jgi:hypothetical protein
MKKLAPWPAPSESLVYGPLSFDHMDEYVSRVFRPDPAVPEIDLKLRQIQVDRDREQLEHAVERLARERAELKELKEQLKRLREPEPEPKIELREPEPEPKVELPARRGRPQVLPGDMETLHTLRAEHPGFDCRSEFLATLPKKLEKRQKAQRYRDADKELRKASGKSGK